jgi:hypothetical protein
MGVVSLIRSALHPGTSLKHEGHKLMPVDALHALAVLPKESSVVIHARLGEDNLPALRGVVLHLTIEVFAQREWKIPQRRKFTGMQTLRFFVEQVSREYLGEPCRRCNGHGYLGRKYDTIRHRLGTCETCHGQGFVMMAMRGSQGKIRKPCATCRGKRLVEISDEVKARRLKSCPVCWGSGSIRASVRARARALHYGHSQVHAVWQQRFRVVLAELRAKELDGLMICREYLFGN